MRLSLYYKLHLRSLFISKFSTFDFGDFFLKKVIVMRLGIKKNKPNLAGPAALFLFMAAGMLPKIFYRIYKNLNKNKPVGCGLVVFLYANYFFMLMEKLAVLYLPYSLNLIAKSGLLLRRLSDVYLFDIRFFEIFPELDFFVNYNYALLQSLSKKWRLEFFCFWPYDRYILHTVLRSLQLPVFVA